MMGLLSTWLGSREADADDCGGCNDGSETKVISVGAREGQRQQGHDATVEGWRWQHRTKEEGGLERATIVGVVVGEGVIGSDGRKMRREMACRWLQREGVDRANGRRADVRDGRGDSDCNGSVSLSLPASALDHELVDPNGLAKPLVVRVFSFFEAAVSLLKSALPPGSKHLSLFQCLGAHVWRYACHARDLTIFGLLTGTASGLLLESQPEFAAGMLQLVIEAHNSDAIKKNLEEYEVAPPKLFHYRDTGMNCVAMGSSSKVQGVRRRLRVEGAGEGPKRLQQVVLRMVFLYPRREGGKSIGVELTVQAEVMERLEKEEELLSVKAREQSKFTTSICC
ncbi:hypothetical protein B296_00008381 [Ensete ventricosum]|uniref:Uncharacterized protein n=1 Tax=Ensete ventricosum TaxID=4639 RepID=A0A426ZPP7_ENSVE|nr:hypothetical protein B296_00008381 [Ensete ventricosum]